MSVNEMESAFGVRCRRYCRSRVLCIGLLSISGLGCAANIPPDRYARLVCFDGFAEANVMAGLGSGGGNGQVSTRSVYVLGDMPDEAIVELSKRDCSEGE